MYTHVSNLFSERLLKEFGRRVFIRYKGLLNMKFPADILHSSRRFFLAARNLLGFMRLVGLSIVHPINLGSLLKLQSDLRDVLRSGSVPIISWAQDGEDIVLAELAATPFFVDIGSHHPFRFSVTKKLTDAGWSGLNIDFYDDFNNDFSRFRPNQTNIKAILDTRAREIELFQYQDRALNTISLERKLALEGQGYLPESTQTVYSNTFLEIYRHQPNQGPIGLLSIDCEGSDFEILKTIPLKESRVENVLIEIQADITNLEQNEVVRYLKGQEYALIHYFGRSGLFTKKVI